MDTLALIALAVGGIIISAAVKFGKTLSDEQPPADNEGNPYEYERDEYDFDGEDQNGRLNNASGVEKPREQVSWFEGTYKSAEKPFSANDYDSELLAEYEANRSVSKYVPMQYNAPSDEEIRAYSHDNNEGAKIDFDLRKAVLYSEILRTKYFNIN